MNKIQFIQKEMLRVRKRNILVLLITTRETTIVYGGDLSNPNKEFYMPIILDSFR